MAPPWYRFIVASAPVVIGLTGGIASGKSAAAAILREHGAAVVDADELARQVVAPGQPALSEIVARFGAEMLLPDGRLDRKKLATRVFSDPQARADLERITHPRIAQASRNEIMAHGARGARIVFYEAALLVENGMHRTLDALVVVATPTDIQLQRLMNRDQLSVELAEARISAQLPLAQKLEAATWVIDNRGDSASLWREVERVLTEIKTRFGSPSALSHP
jgi:dephospho-CoA kinase